MLLAQVDAVTTSGLSDFAGKFGFPALLVLVLLFGLWKLLSSAAEERQKRDTRDEVREVGRRDERKEDREAHLSALGKHTEVIAQLVVGLTRLEQKVDNQLAMGLTRLEQKVDNLVATIKKLGE